MAHGAPRRRQGNATAGVSLEVDEVQDQPADAEVRGLLGAPPSSAPVDLDAPALYLNRELSWLEFNRRVLAMATDSQVPLLDRLHFLSIFAGNLDEFFMVRVAGLKRQVEAGLTRRTPDGRTPSEQLTAISRRLRPVVTSAQDCLHQQLLPVLERRGIALLGVDELSQEQRKQLDEYFEEEAFPVLTPLAVDPGHPFPYISNLSLSLAVTVRDRKTGSEHFARVKVPTGVLPRFVTLPDGSGWVPLEELIEARLDRLFPGMDIVDAAPFRVTRNSDLDLEEEEAEDLLMAIERELSRRRFGAVVRLEVSDRMSQRVLGLLQEELDVGDIDTYRIRGLLGLGDLDQLAALDLPGLHWPDPGPVVPQAFCAAGEPASPAQMFARIRRGDVLVHHPYESFTHSVEHFVTAASDDPDVLAIKQTLYRTSGDSPIVQALIRAAEQGKQVVALVELKARFDEAANISWARALEKVGVHVVYGLVGLKTHSKTSLVVRHEAGGLRRYAHIGTGNYNPRTARNYTDLGLFTCDEEVGADLTDLFNYLTGYARHDQYRRLMVAPVGLRERIRELIQGEVEAHEAGREGLIRLKLNAVLDSNLVADLYRASQAGVRVDIVCRGICALRPGVPGVSDRIRVVSVVGRFLEHSRILQFGPDNFWIGSADWMPRNLDRRVEVMVPVREAALRDELRWTLDTMLADTVQGWTLGADGGWTRRFPADGEPPVDSQGALMDRARARAAARGGTPSH